MVLISFLTFAGLFFSLFFEHRLSAILEVEREILDQLRRQVS